MKFEKGERDRERHCNEMERVVSPEWSELWTLFFISFSGRHNQSKRRDLNFRFKENVILKWDLKMLYILMVLVYRGVGNDASREYKLAGHACLCLA